MIFARYFGKQQVYKNDNYLLNYKQLNTLNEMRLK